MPVEIRKIKDKPCELYSPEDELIGTIKDMLQFYDVRVQIKQEGRRGYYLRFKRDIIKIDENGELEKYPNGLFDTFTGLACQLI